ncbi:MAG: hypothetical protein B7Y39_03990 [Bdellovibrio sp. 28-41-41]|nr:MAG: hypothetical protein B7Y39_03990 [Bdellovibrio sp. 28-41-41]
MLKKLLLLIVGFSFAASLAFASNEPVNLSQFLIQSDQALPAVQQDELLFNYDSKNFDGRLLDKFSKAELLEMIRTNALPDIEKGKKLTSVSIPFGLKVDWDVVNRNDEEAFKSRHAIVTEFKKYKIKFAKESIEAINNGLGNLSEDELRTLLSKKHAFLSGVADSFERTFLKFKIKPPYTLIQKLVNSLNGVFYQRSEQFVKANTFGTNIYMVAGAGAALGQLLYDFVISKTPLKQFVSPKFGFYLGTSLGLGISRVKVGEKSAWMLDMFFDFESLKRAFAPILEGYAGAGMGLYMEARDLPPVGRRAFVTKDGYDSAFYAPFIGTNRTGPTSLANQHTLNMSFPIPSTFFETKLTRRYFHIVLKKNYKDEITDPAQKIGFFKALTMIFKPINSNSSAPSACMRFYKSL